MFLDLKNKTEADRWKSVRNHWQDWKKQSHHRLWNVYHPSDFRSNWIGGSSKKVGCFWGSFCIFPIELKNSSYGTPKKLRQCFKSHGTGKRQKLRLVFLWSFQSQPLCDGAHRSGSGMKSLVFQPERSGTQHLCMCKQTKNPPYCDGTHRSL